MRIVLNKRGGIEMGTTRTELVVLPFLGGFPFKLLEIVLYNPSTYTPKGDVNLIPHARLA